MGGPPKIGGKPKMDGENKGKPYEQMDDLGGKPPIFGNTHMKQEGKTDSFPWSLALFLG